MRSMEWLHLVNEDVPHHLNQQAVEMIQSQNQADLLRYLENHAIIQVIMLRIVQDLSY